MRASDIPAGYSSSNKMAASLATYVNCPVEIRRRVLGVFDVAPSVSECARLRASFLRPERPTEPVKTTDAYYPSDAGKDMDRRNSLFVRALQIERQRSEQMKREIARLVA